MTTTTASAPEPALATPPARLSLKAFLHDIGDEVFSLDHGLPWTFLRLCMHPGQTIRRYVEWRDSRLTRPLRYLLICLAVAALLLHAFSMTGDAVAGIEQGFLDASPHVGTAAVSALGNQAEAFVIGMYVLAQLALLESLLLVLMDLPGISAALPWLDGLVFLLPFGYLGWVCLDYFADEGRRIGPALFAVALAACAMLFLLVAVVVFVVTLASRLAGVA